MKKTYIYIALFGVIFGLMSCYKDIPLVLDEYEYKIVANGVFFNDTTIRISLSKTVGFGYNTNLKLPRITDAKIALYKDGKFVENMSYIDDGFYEASIVGESGSEYNVIIEADGKTVKGTVVIPEKTAANSIHFIKFDENESQNTIEFNFTDPSGIENYYLIDAFYYDTIYYWNETGGYDSVGIYKYYANVHFPDEMTGVINDMYFSPYVFNGIGFTDKIFHDGTYNLNFLLSVYAWKEDVTVEDSITVYINFYSVNQDIYRFLVSYEKYQNTIGNPLVEPVNVYSNIENGIGILGGFSFTVDSVKIPYQIYEYDW